MLKSRAARAEAIQIRSDSGLMLRRERAQARLLANLLRGRGPREGRESLPPWVAPVLDTDEEEDTLLEVASPEQLRRGFRPEQSGVEERPQRTLVGTPARIIYRPGVPLLQVEDLTADQISIILRWYGIYEDRTILENMLCFEL